MIHLEQLSYRYTGPTGTFQLGPVSLAIPSGKLVFWVGHNGSGKSTLARLLCGELTPDAGNIKGLTGDCAYHHQSVAENIFPELTVEDHFRLLAPGGLPSSDSSGGIYSEISELRRKYPDELSGGQLQMVAFASALLRRHSLYVFDEVFNHLDAAHVERVLDGIRGIIGEGKSTYCVIITHDLELVRKAADVIHIFAHGQIVRTVDRAFFPAAGAQLFELVLNPHPHSDESLRR